MKKLTTFIILLSLCHGLIAQSRFERGAVPGELFLSTYVNNPDYYEIEKGLLYISQNGAEMELMYHTKVFEDTGTAILDTMQPLNIVADLTPGVIYNHYPYNGYRLFRSMDYGISWEPSLLDTSTYAGCFTGGGC
jgi:hypothetical protein